MDERNEKVSVDRLTPDTPTNDKKPLIAENEDQTCEVAKKRTEETPRALKLGQKVLSATLRQ